MSITYTLTDQSLTVLGDDFVPRTMPHTHPAFAEAVDAVKRGDINALKPLLDLPNAIVDFMQGRVQISERVLYYDGRPMDSMLTRRILQFMDDGNPELAQPLINFLDKVMENPSRRAVLGLYEWCEKSGLPITPEGDILAWKIVRPDYKDIHSGTFDNSVGQVVEVARNEVDEDPERTCSYGLHFCSTTYLPHFGGSSGTNNHVMVVKLHPKDVVAFPRDYNTSKGRACRYEVIGEVPPEKARDFFPSRVSYADFGSSYVDNDEDGPLDEELITERYYRTRDGRIAYVEDFDEDRADGDYPYSGYFIGDEDDRDAEWGVRGSWNLYEDHGKDLVELLPYDFDPADEPAPEAEEPRRKTWFERLFSGEV